MDVLPVPPLPLITSNSCMLGHQPLYFPPEAGKGRCPVRVFLHQAFPLGVGSGVPLIKGDFQQHRDTLMVAVTFHPQVPQGGPVDNHGKGNNQFPDHADGEAEVVEAEGCGLRHQQAKVAILHSGYHRAGSARRRVQEGQSLAAGLLFHRPDNRRRQGHTYINLALDEINPTRPAPGYHSDAVGFFRQGSLRAGGDTSAAAVAHLRKDDYPAPGNGQGMKGTGLAAPATAIAPGIIYFRDRQGNRLFLLKDRLQEEMGIRLLDIAVQDLDWYFLCQGQGQVDSDGGFTGASFTTGHCYMHQLHHTSIQANSSIGAFIDAGAALQALIGIDNRHLVHGNVNVRNPHALHDHGCRYCLCF
ncbi:phospholipase C [Moorella thermoacetica Y72]|uniref:Phospholipase C n=1 Tax=Moorella thermoacetica Y72 TaxID=1325331 RepID=A0A0S6UDM4_NEOTH|nr:phospholipase C [Moorella thermoacetica Y72]